MKRSSSPSVERPISERPSVPPLPPNASSPRMAVTRPTPQKPPLSPSKSLANMSSFSIQQPTPSSPINLFGGLIVGSSEFGVDCPCGCTQCRSDDDDDQRQTLGAMPTKISNRSLLSDDEEEEKSADSAEEEAGGLLPGGLITGGRNYHPKRILVEGWLHKKGTGRDWMGSTSWKGRWCRLIMARVDGFEVDVPLLMTYWSSGSSTPSSVIILNSTVVFPIDKEDKEQWDAYQFEVRNARAVTTNSTVNRMFTAPKKARDAWIYAISQALLMYEKANDKARKAAAATATAAYHESQRLTHSLSPMLMHHRPEHPSFEVWPRGDRPGTPPQYHLRSPITKQLQQQEQQHLAADNKYMPMTASPLATDKCHHNKQQSATGPESRSPSEESCPAN